MVNNKKKGEKTMKKWIFRVSGTVVTGIAAFAFYLGNTVTAFSFFPVWSYEPEMPAVLKAKLED